MEVLKILGIVVLLLAIIIGIPSLMPLKVGFIEGLVKNTVSVYDGNGELNYNKVTFEDGRVFMFKNTEPVPLSGKYVKFKYEILAYESGFYLLTADVDGHMVIAHKHE